VAILDRLSHRCIASEKELAVMDVPRNKYPRPQFVRRQWQCLNGPWQFEIDNADDGIDRGLRDRDLERTITVPFCPESALSGIEHTDFMAAVWYRRTVTLPRQWAGRRTLLHFQAVDYDATVWANGVEVGRHIGGFTPFACDLSKVAAPGDAVTIVVRARDDHKALKPKGKQCHERDNRACLYTRTTGIWQTVWIEPVPEACRLDRPTILPDVGGSRFIIEQPLVGRRSGLTARAVLRDAEGDVAHAACPAEADFTPRLVLEVPDARRRLWSPDDPHLYDLEIELSDGEGRVVDSAASYAGLRSITIDGPVVRLNGEALFQRLVLDQGYYPDGIMTAPSDEALQRDIELSMAAGFNGARLHQKVFEERFLAHADRMGYLVWGEFADWGCRDPDSDVPLQKPDASYVAQWTEVLARDVSHPSIVGWCPLNETGELLGDRATVLDEVTRAMFHATKRADPTRPVLDASGHSHRVAETDVYDSHDYDQNPATFKARHDKLLDGNPFLNTGGDGAALSISWDGQPFFVSEFGGIWWNAAEAATETDGSDRKQSWGYGQRVRTIEEFYERFEGPCRALLENPRMFGYCYTQLTDTFQEQNGLYDFQRQAKFDLQRLRAIQQRKAAIEKAQR
jgi:beta-galactosidase/beta-glucuronidase